jgi:hypothetical protein
MAVVAESGSLKSPAQDLALGPLRRLQGWRIEEYAESREGYERDLMLYDVDLRAWKNKGAKQGEPPPEKPTEPTIARYLVNDITVEALADRLDQNPRGLLADVDELAVWVRGFDQYRRGKGGDVARWLSIHRAGSLLNDRKTTDQPTLFIRRAAVSIAGGIQPATLRRVLAGEHWENGLAARLLVAAPPPRRKRWTDASVDLDCVRQVERVFGRLLALVFGKDTKGSPAPEDIPLAPDGREVWVRFYDEHAEAQADATGALASVLSKIEAVAPRIALVSHLVRQVAGELPEALEGIDVQSMAAGVTLARWFAAEAQRVYQMLGEDPAQQKRRHLVEWIVRRGGRVTTRELVAGMRKIKTAAEAEALLNQLADAGDGHWDDNPTGTLGGRPSRVFVLADANQDEAGTWRF